MFQEQILSTNFDIYIVYSQEDTRYQKKVKQHLSVKETNLKLFEDQGKDTDCLERQDLVFKNMVASKR